MDEPERVEKRKDRRVSMTGYLIGLVGVIVGAFAGGWTGVFVEKQQLNADRQERVRQFCLNELADELDKTDQLVGPPLHASQPEVVAEMQTWMKLVNRAFVSGMPPAIKVFPWIVHDALARVAVGMQNSQPVDDQQLKWILSATDMERRMCGYEGGGGGPFPQWVSR